MSDPHDREPADQATIDGWRVNYGLDKRTPADAARYWADRCAGMAPAGAVAALGIALDDLDALRKDAEEAVRSSVAAAVAAERERWIVKAGAAYAEAHAIFNNPPSETSQDVRDVIEWHLYAMRHSEIET